MRLKEFLIIPILLKRKVMLSTSVMCTKTKAKLDSDLLRGPPTHFPLPSLTVHIRGLK